MTIPITIITGFLGSGKTTLVNHIVAANEALPSSQCQRYAIVENEFALEFGIENELLLGGQGKQEGSNMVREVFEFGNGCICCSAQGEFFNILNELAEHVREGKAQFDNVLVETTGLAGSLTGSVDFPPAQLRDVFHLASIITVVDSVNFIRHLQDSLRPPGSKNEAWEQVVSADVIILNKVDLLADRSQLHTTLTSINPSADIVETEYSRITLPDLHSHVRAGTGNKAATVATDEGQASVFAQASARTLNHDASVKPEILVVEGYVRPEALKTWLDTLVASNGENIFRLKGVFHAREGGRRTRYVAQGVHERVHLTKVERDEADDPGEALNKLVLIGRDLRDVGKARQASFVDHVMEEQ